MISTRGQNKQVPFSVMVVIGTVDNEGGVIRKFHPNSETPTILRVPDDLSYRNAGRHINANKMQYLSEDRVRAVAGTRKAKPHEMMAK